VIRAHPVHMALATVRALGEPRRDDHAWRRSHQTQGEAACLAHLQW